jgi:putative endonuclease
MAYFVYILYSKNLGTFYKGQTSDLTDRLKRHNSGYEKATKSGAPWILLWNTEKETRSQAVQLELKLKNLSRLRLVQFMLKYQDGVASPDELLLLKQQTGC